MSHKYISTSVQKFKTINSNREKVEIRTYKSGISRCYIYQGDTWYPMEMELFERYRNDGIIIKDE